MSAESAVGAGSTFTVPLPLPSSDEPIDGPAVPSALQGLRVPIVDDNRVNRRVIHQHICSWGMRNGSLRRPRKRRPPCARRATRATRTRSSLPTTTCRGSTGERCLEAGMNDYVSKPVKLEHLERTIARHVELLPA